jgi:hypothetical protein
MTGGGVVNPTHIIVMAGLVPATHFPEAHQRSTGLNAQRGNRFWKMGHRDEPVMTVEG